VIPLRITLTIPANASLSNAADLSELVPVGVLMPSAWTAASLTFQASLDGVSFVDLYNTSGSELQVPAGANRLIALDPVQFRGVRHLRVRSGTSGAPVNQTASRTLVILAVPSNSV
jgi:hypothetical protein